MWYNRHMNCKNTYKNWFFVTVSWRKSVGNASQLVKRALFHASKVSKTHIWFSIHEGIQMKRFQRTGVKHPDLHIVVALEHDLLEERLDALKLAFELKLLKLHEKPNVLWDPMDWSRNWIEYAFKHEIFTSEMACPRLQRCRRNKKFCINLDLQPFEYGIGGVHP